MPSLHLTPIPITIGPLSLPLAQAFPASHLHLEEPALRGRSTIDRQGIYTASLVSFRNVISSTRPSLPLASPLLSNPAAYKQTGGIGVFHLRPATTLCAPLDAPGLIVA
jgi:hypothetical protein